MPSAPLPSFFGIVAVDEVPVWHLPAHLLKPVCAVSTSVVSALCAVSEEHACIEIKAGRLYCTALVGDPDNFMDATFTWVNGSELRPGTKYFSSLFFPNYG